MAGRRARAALAALATERTRRRPGVGPFWADGGGGGQRRDPHVFLGVAYVVLLRDRVRHPLLVLWQDAEPALVSLVGLAAPVNLLLASSSLGVIPHLLGTSPAAGAGYVIALRIAPFEFGCSV